MGGIVATEEPNPSNGFTQQNTELLDNADNVRRSNLTVITSAENNNNNSEIYCQAFGSANTNSNTATIIIQGIFIVCIWHTHTLPLLSYRSIIISWWFILFFH